MGIADSHPANGVRGRVPLLNVDGAGAWFGREGGWVLS